MATLVLVLAGVEATPRLSGPWKAPWGVWAGVSKLWVCVWALGAEGSPVGAGLLAIFASVYLILL